MKIRIADLPIEWQEDRQNYVETFSSQTQEEPIMVVGFENKLPECHGIQYPEKNTEHILRTGNGEMLCANSDWSKVTSYFTAELGEYALTLAAMCSRLSYYDTVLIHASCIDLDGEGVIFTGFSGVGKTTQAKLWQDCRGADIINGDKVFVREIDGSFYGCGLPWKGSSEYCLNKKTKLKAIIVLRRSKENKITKLNTLSAIEYFMPHIFIPHWDEKCTDNACSIFEKILEKVPVFLLECRPDEDAVTLVENTVFK